ncbi:hypothetical protein PybrP1_007314 [[Pythium] brassicae (nom. inval.)]|nr:hypothetical protein PybrP1_007314 [[Pythium] brassicae (nom. inval.)]
MRVGAIAAAALVAVIATPMLASAATCTVPQKTLTFSCDSACSNQYSPCWRNASITSTSPSCPYECYDIYFSDTAKTNFVFLVPFKAADNSAYAAADAKSADLKTYIYKSNDLVSKIGTLALPSSTTKVTLIGGSFYKTKYIKGRVVTLDLADDLVAKQTQVTDAYLASIDLRTAVKAMTTMLPLSTKVINFENNLLEDFPADFAKFTTLQELALDVNNVSSFNAMFKNTTLCAVGEHAVRVSDRAFRVPSSRDSVRALAFDALGGYLDHNSITEVDKSHVTDSLTKLYAITSEVWCSGFPNIPADAADMGRGWRRRYLGVNSITKFDAVFPKLTYLDLRSNNLTKIPDAIFKHTSLTFLYAQ